MRFASVLTFLFKYLFIVAFISTAYVYLYPVAHGCGFPPPIGARNGTTIAPFRLLAFGDPQLEGDSSLPDDTQLAFTGIQRIWSSVSSGVYSGTAKELRTAAEDLILEDIPRFLQYYRKRLDLLGNDYYLAHIYRAVQWWTRPTHVVVLGDLLGSQWIDDTEFDRRANRYWNRVFKGAHKLPNVLPSHITSLNWRRTLMNVAGNHDIGYAGDLDIDRTSRFERKFGPVNWNITFELNLNTSQLEHPIYTNREFRPKLSIIILNSMNLDGPAYNKDLQAESRAFLNQQIDGSSRWNWFGRTGAVLLTHIPLFREQGLCADGPYTTYFPPDQGGGISEQNHLSENTSADILSMFRSGIASFPYHSGIIMNGHDHEGCDVEHTYTSVFMSNMGNWGKISRIKEWSTIKYRPHFERDLHPLGVREVTVRSMMGSYGGNAGLLSGWFDEDVWEWRFEYSSCTFGVQHIWWAVHGLDIVVLLLGLTLIPVRLFGSKDKAVTATDSKKRQ